MKTKNAMQLKARIKNHARELGVPPQLVMQNYLLERVMERIALSPWQDNIVVKGGMLISSLIGSDKRSTKDLDTTIRGFDLTHENAEKAFREIAANDADDDFIFEFIRTEDIREIDEYPGIRVHLIANYEKISSPVTIDVTTGDKITPDAISYSYPLMLDDRSIELMAYPIETVLAEKLETVLSRDVTNTRPRDYYDLHSLWHIWQEGIDTATLKKALKNTAEKRNTMKAIGDYPDMMSRVAEDDSMLRQWDSYSRRYPYVGDLTLREACEDVIEIMDRISW